MPQIVVQGADEQLEFDVPSLAHVVSQMTDEVRHVWRILEEDIADRISNRARNPGE